MFGERETMAENLESQTDKKNEFVSASFIKRFAAAFGEYLLILSIPSILFILSDIFAELGAGILFGILFTFFYGASILVIIAIVIILPVFLSVYFEQSRFKATPLKMLLGLQVFNVDGTETELPQLVHRAIFKNIIIIVIAILFFNFINMPDYSGWYFLIPVFILIIYNIAGVAGWLPFKPKGQALNDQLAGTIVLQKACFKNRVSIFSMILIPFILFILTFKIFLMWSIGSFNIITIVPGCFNGKWVYRLILGYSRDKTLMIKNNMHNIQDLLEDYGKSTGGIYPKNLQELSVSTYWKKFTNPYCASMSGIGGALLDYKEYKQRDKYSGFILYEPIGNPPKRYFIYGCDIKGDLVYYLLPHTYTTILDLQKEPILKQLFPFTNYWQIMYLE